MRYEIKDLDKVIANVQNNSASALKKCWFYLENKIKEQIEKDSKDTWTLKDSVSTIEVKPWLVEVWTNLEYALVREYGRRPWKFPPMDALVGWTSRKHMIKWGATSKYDDLHYTDKWVVFVIARAIARRGIEWKHTFETVVNREKQNIIDLYAKYMREW